jgi:hypothetical protein
LGYAVKNVSPLSQL